MEQEKKRILPTVSLQDSYRLCQRMTKQDLGAFRWMVGNLPRETQSHLNAVLALLVRTERLCDIHLARAARLELLDDLREDFRNNFMEEESTDQFPALLDTMQQFSIRQQYLHDIIAAADMCVRIDRFESFDQWLQLGYRLGAGTLLSAIPITGIEKPDYEPLAMKCGQAIYLTHLLNDIVDEIQKLEYFMPAADIEKFSVDLARHNPSNPSEEILQLIKFQIERIEKLFHDGGNLVNYLSLDGKRVMTSVISVTWNLLMKMKRNPKKLLLNSFSLSQKEMFGFRLKHLMGLENAPAILPLATDRDQH